MIKIMNLKRKRKDTVIYVIPMDNYALLFGREEQNVYRSRRWKNLNKKRVNIVLSAPLKNIYVPVLGEINWTGQRMMKWEAKKKKRRRKRNPQNQIGTQIWRRHRIINARVNVPMRRPRQPPKKLTFKPH